MSKVINAHIKTFEDPRVPPRIIVTLDHTNVELLFEQRGSLYRGEHPDSDVVRFFAYDKPGHGFGGDIYRITMLDGSKKDLIGPWSSRDGCINAAFQDKEPTVECVSDKWSVVTNVKVNVLRKFGVTLYRIVKHGEVTYQLRRPS